MINYISLGYQLIMSNEDAESVVNNILGRLDDNHNGFIDYSEFVMATIDKKIILNNKNLRMVFDLIDKVKIDLNVRIMMGF